MSREALEAQPLRLPSEERTYLARGLFESLDDQPELDPSWLEEAKRRAFELASGVVQAVPAATVFGETRRKLAGRGQSFTRVPARNAPKPPSASKRVLSPSARLLGRYRTTTGASIAAMPRSMMPATARPEPTPAPLARHPRTT